MVRKINDTGKRRFWSLFLVRFENNNLYLASETVNGNKTHFLSLRQDGMGQEKKMSTLFEGSSKLLTKILLTKIETALTMDDMNDISSLYWV